MTRWCAEAVACSLSIASVANDTAVSNPNVIVVSTMSLSIVFGTHTTGRRQFESIEAFDDGGGIVDEFAVFPRIGEGIAPVRRAENGAAEPVDARDVGDRDDEGRRRQRQLGARAGRVTRGADGSRRHQ